MKSKLHKKRPVIKLGGGTVADANAVAKVINSIDWSELPVLVVSAPAGITDTLIPVSYTHLTLPTIYSV